MIIRKMQVETRSESLQQTTYELRHKNNSMMNDDVMRIVVPAGDVIPRWAVGQFVTVSIIVDGE